MRRRRLALFLGMGDVDFIFGRGTGVFDGCQIQSLSRGSSSNNGYVTAAATDTANPYGFLFYRCDLTNMSGFSWQDARFDEYKNTGSGSGVNSNRPQLTDAQAPNYTPQKYLAGADGWNPL